MLGIETLDGATVERAGALVACEQAAARRVRPELPAAFENPDVCTAALQRLCDSGQRGLVVMGNRRAAAVMAAAARENPAVGRYALLLAEGLAVDPHLADPTGVLAAAFADLAAPLIADGVRRCYLLHTALPRLSQALSNLGFGRRSAYGIQPAAPRRGSSAVAVRIAGAGDLETIARLALVELQHRSAPPMFAPRQDRPLADLVAEHRALHEAGAVHLLATLDGHDAGLLTIELTSPVPRLCPDGQPYIGPTATLPAARGKASGTRSSTPRSPGPMTTATNGSRSTSTPPTRCPGHSGCTPASARPDTASSASSTAARRPSPDPPTATEHRSSPLPGSCTGIRRGPPRRSCGHLPLSYIEGRAQRLRLDSRPPREIDLIDSPVV